MSISILLGRVETGAEVAGFSFDATLSEDHDRESRVTESAIEDGSVIQDHVVREPERVTIEGYVTDTPIVPLGIDPGRDFQGPVDAFEKLDELWHSGEPIDIITGYASYQNMVIDGLEMPRRQDAQGLRFTLRAVKIRIVEAETAALPEGAVDPDIEDSAAPENDAGPQQSASASGAEESRTLGQLTVDGIRGLLELR